MNYHAYKFTENDHGYYFYFLSPFNGEEMDLVEESIEHYIANDVKNPMCEYLNHIDFDNVKIEKVIGGSVMDIVNNSFPQDDKNMSVSDSYKPLIPPPKPKRTPKPKADKPTKEPKAKGKKSTQKVDISTENTTLNMNN